MGFRLHLSRILAIATGAILFVGLLAAPATAGTHRSRHDHRRSHAGSWKQWHRERDHPARFRNRHHHARHRRSPEAWKQHRHPARSLRPIASCIQEAKLWSNRVRAGRHPAKHCRRSQPRRPIRSAPATLRPTQPVSHATQPARLAGGGRPAATSGHEPADVIGVAPTPTSSPPTTVCEPTTTTTTRAPTTSGTTTTTTTQAPTTSGTTTTTSTTTTQAPTSTTVEPTTTTTSGQPPTTQTTSPSYVPAPANQAGPTASPTTTGYQPAGPTGTSAPTTTLQASTTAQPTTSTVCQPNAGGQLPSTGSSALPMLAAVVVLFAGGLSVLRIARTRPPTES